MKKEKDHRFKATYDKAIKWDAGDANELMSLPKGVKVKIFNYDPVMKRVDFKVKFPKGYVEPKHTHKSWHSLVVLKGRMCVAGKDLRPGDYVFGWDLPHGPYEYPDGCEVFCVMMGGGASHVWDEDALLKHKTKWKAKTPAGKKAVAKAEASRKRALEKLKAAKKAAAKKKATTKKKTAPKKKAASKKKA